MNFDICGTPMSINIVYGCPPPEENAKVKHYPSAWKEVKSIDSITGICDQIVIHDSYYVQYLLIFKPIIWALLQGVSPLRDKSKS